MVTVSTVFTPSEDQTVHLYTGPSLFIPSHMKHTIDLIFSHWIFHLALSRNPELSVVSVAFSTFYPYYGNAKWMRNILNCQKRAKLWWRISARVKKRKKSYVGLIKSYVGVIVTPT